MSKLTLSQYNDVVKKCNANINGYLSDFDKIYDAIKPILLLRTPHTSSNINKLFKSYFNLYAIYELMYNICITFEDMAITHKEKIDSVKDRIDMIDRIFHTYHSHIAVEHLSPHGEQIVSISYKGFVGGMTRQTPVVTMDRPDFLQFLSQPVTPSSTVTVPVRPTKPEPVMPKPESVVPQPETVVPQPETVVPQPETVVPQPETVVPQPETVVPQPETVVLQPETVVLQPETVVLQPETVVLQPETVVLQPEPEPEPVIPQPEVTVPSHSTEPEPIVSVEPVMPQPSEPEPVGPEPTRILSVEPIGPKFGNLEPDKPMGHDTPASPEPFGSNPVRTTKPKSRSTEIVRRTTPMQPTYIHPTPQQLYIWLSRLPPGMLDKFKKIPLLRQDIVPMLSAPRQSFDIIPYSSSSSKLVIPTDDKRFGLMMSFIQKKLGIKQFIVWIQPQQAHRTIKNIDTGKIIVSGKKQTPTRGPRLILSKLVELLFAAKTIEDTIFIVPNVKQIIKNDHMIINYIVPDIYVNIFNGKTTEYLTQLFENRINVHIVVYLIDTLPSINDEHQIDFIDNDVTIQSFVKYIKYRLYYNRIRHNGLYKFFKNDYEIDNDYFDRLFVKYRNLKKIFNEFDVRSSVEISEVKQYLSNKEIVKCFTGLINKTISDVWKCIASAKNIQMLRNVDPRDKPHRPLFPLSKFIRNMDLPPSIISKPEKQPSPVPIGPGESPPSIIISAEATNNPAKRQFPGVDIYPTKLPERVSEPVNPMSHPSVISLLSNITDPVEHVPASSTPERPKPVPTSSTPEESKPVSISSTLEESKPVPTLSTPEEPTLKISVRPPPIALTEPSTSSPITTSRPDILYDEPSRTITISGPVTELPAETILKEPPEQALRLLSTTIDIVDEKTRKSIKTIIDSYDKVVTVEDLLRYIAYTHGFDYSFDYRSDYVMVGGSDISNNIILNGKEELEKIIDIAIEIYKKINVDIDRTSLKSNLDKLKNTELKINKILIFCNYLVQLHHSIGDIIPLNKEIDDLSKQLVKLINKYETQYAHTSKIASDLTKFNSHKFE